VAPSSSSYVTKSCYGVFFIFFYSSTGPPVTVEEYGTIEKYLGVAWRESPRRDLKTQVRDFSSSPNVVLYRSLAMVFLWFFRDSRAYRIYTALAIVTNAKHYN